MSFPVRALRACAALLASAVGAAPASAGLDLSGWQAEGYGQVPTWQVEPGGTAVVVVGNEESSLFAGGIAALPRTISLTVRVETDLDNDFFGFALGFDPGDTASAAADFVYLDWKKSTGLSPIGMAVSRVQGVPVDLTELGFHAGDHVTELARAATLGEVGWVEHVDYRFEVELRSDNLKVWVDGVLEFDLDGSFSPGGFALYNRSQQDVRYRDVEIDPLASIPALPLPFLGLLAAALAAALLHRARWAHAAERRDACDPR